MGKRKTYFEQVPLALVRAVAHEILRPPTGLAYCVICEETVELERCKADEDGDAVHEACYVSKLAQTSRSSVARRA
jgi:hypothetical protein